MIPPRAVVCVLLAAIAAAGCTSGAAQVPPATRPASLALADSPAGLAIRATIGQINATAAGPIEAQRAVLDRLAAPGEAADQRACPAATTTLSFDPAYRDLRLAPPGDRDDDGSPGAGETDGVEYLLPSYITIYTGGRITGSDLTTVHLWVQGGVARTAALCVS